MRVLVTTLAALTLAGCAGPNTPLNIGTQTQPVGLVLGEHAAVVEAPVGPITTPIPPSLAPFLPTTPVTTSSLAPSALPLPSHLPVAPCPDFDPTAPVVPTGTNIPGPPQPGTYTYRAKTTDTLGKTSATYSGSSTWTTTVSTPDPVTGGYTVTTVVAIGKARSQRVLLILPKAVASGTPLDAPDGTDPNAQVIDFINAELSQEGLPLLPRAVPNAARFGPAGVYLVSQSSGTSTFKPSVPIPLVQTPIGDNSFTAFGSDGSTAMMFTSTVTNKTANVNACGSKLQAVEVTLSAGKIVSLTSAGKLQSVDFTEKLDFGLQYGGLPLRDQGTVSGLTLPGGAVAPDTIARTFDFTANRPLKPART
jgi:hypothetical protein